MARCPLAPPHLLRSGCLRQPPSSRRQLSRQVPPRPRRPASTAARQRRCGPLAQRALPGTSFSPRLQPRCALTTNLAGLAQPSTWRQRSPVVTAVSALMSHACMTAQCQCSDAVHPRMQAPSWRDLYLSATQPRASAPPARPRVVGAVNRRPIAGSGGGSGGGGALAASGDVARPADGAEEKLNGAGPAPAAEGSAAPGVAPRAHAAAASVADGGSPAADRVQQRTVAPPDVGRKRNRKATAPRRCASLPLLELCHAVRSAACQCRAAVVARCHSHRSRSHSFALHSHPSQGNGLRSRLTTHGLEAMSCRRADAGDGAIVDPQDRQNKPPPRPRPRPGAALRVSLAATSLTNSQPMWHV